MTTNIATSSPFDDIASKANATADDVATTVATVAEEGEKIALSAKDALAEMRRIVQDFAASTGEKASAAASAVGATGTATAERFGELLDDARVLGRDGLDELADGVSKRPLTALAVAAGVGLVLGLMTRPGSAR